MAAMAAMTAANAQTTYNYFDPSDCDANGWLWFDTQEKIDKYCGFGSKYKIQLQSATFESGDGQFAEPECYADEEGYNEAGELGGEGSKTGAIILPAAATTNDNPNGGGIMMWPTVPSLTSSSRPRTTVSVEAYSGQRDGSNP